MHGCQNALLLMLFDFRIQNYGGAKTYISISEHVVSCSILTFYIASLKV
jgi:hypothetical protein